MKAYKILLALLMLSLFACDSDDDGDADETEGDISGSVTLFNDSNIPQPSDGMLVTVVGTSYQATTDSNGSFEMEDVPFGTYQLQYEKDGYGTYISDEYEHQGTSDDDDDTQWPENPLLGQLSTTTITESTAVLDGEDFIITAQTAPESSVVNPLYITIFLSSNPDVSNTINSAVVGVLKTESNPTEIRITRNELGLLGFSSDETVHIKVYGDSFYPNAYSSLGSIIHPNANPQASTTMNLVVQ